MGKGLEECPGTRTSMCKLLGGAYKFKEGGLDFLMWSREISGLTVIGFSDVEVGVRKFHREDKALSFDYIVFEMSQRLPN